MAALLSPQFAKESWGKQATELAISQIPFNDQDVLGALKEYAMCANDLRSALLHKSNLKTQVHL
ncbi:hypothetical protein LBM341_04487 (plasmid) [Ralstonia solanacearum]|nr:hypothetical protein LBM341_04487 [Ralstonia solanacearum]NKA16305.1 hypothetical protein [Ralstonia solanacearum]NKA51320.1 hypothetical protein [Ralstonia solanacearum]